MSDFSHIPDGYHSVSPYLVSQGATAAIDWHKDVFGATVMKPMADQFYGDRSGTVNDPWGLCGRLPPAGKTSPSSK